MQEAEESQPPNRWGVTLIIVALAQALGTGGITLVYPFLPLYIQTLREAHFISPELLAGLVIGAPPLVASLAMPFWGRLADQYGRKKMVMRALFGAAIVLLLMGFAETALALIALRALQGLTSGIIASSMALVAGESPRERIGFAIGTLQVGLFGGAAIGPLVGGVLAEHFGFRIPFLFTSAMLVLAGLLVTIGVRETYRPASDSKLNLNPRKMLQAWGGILRARGVKTVYCLRFLNGFAQRSIMPIAPLFVMALIPSALAAGASSYAGLVITVSSIAITAGSFVFGWLGDRWGYRNVLILTSLMAMLFYVPQALVANVHQLLVLQALAGFAAGGVLSAPAAMLAKYTDLGAEGSVYGLDASVSSFANGMAPMTASVIAAMFGLRAVFAAVAIYYLSILLIGARLLPKSKRRLFRFPAAVSAGS
ncbi:MAG: MFS transporter [Chloroflexota bacterium]|nr:MFS transporter [Chloroflexota bacterium]MDE2945873.1 MFS transporter [Chloroflexota bacterium]